MQKLFLIATAILSSFQCTAGEVAPRDLQSLAQKWNIDNPIFNHDSISFDMDYLVSDFVLDTMADYSIWDFGCEEGGYPLSNDIIDVVKSTQPGFVQNTAGTGNRMIELDLKLVSDEIVKEPRIFKDFLINGKATATVEFCVRFKLTTPGGGVEVNFLESLVILYVDLTDGFSIDNIIVSPKIIAEKTANQGYEVDAFFCDLEGNPLSEEEANAPRLPATELRICVVPTQKALDEGVFMRAIEFFYYFRIDERGNTIIQDAIVNRMAAANGLTAGLNCDAGIYCEFSSLIKADFYQDEFGTDVPTAAPTKFNEFEYCSQFSDIEILAISDFSLDYERLYPLYNNAVAGRTIQFNDDAQTCTTAANPSCTTINHPSCTISGGTFDESLGYTMNFNGQTPVATGGCCSANSCAGVYLGTQEANLLAGDQFRYTYKATGGGDWYEAAIVLYEGISPATINTRIVDARVVRGSSIRDFKTESFTIPADGTYFLGFFTASYDASGGGALGANMQVIAFSYTGGAAPLPGDPTSAPTASPDPDFVIPAFCDQYIARRRLGGEQPPLVPSQPYFEERPRRGLQAGITVLGVGVATLKFPGRRLGAPEQEYYYEGRDLQEDEGTQQGAEINIQFTVIDGEPAPRSSASATSVLLTMSLFLAGALIAHHM